MLLEVGYSILKEQEKPFSIWTWWIVNLMQGCSERERGEERRGRKRDRRGLTQGFEKFIKILTPLHLPGAGKVRHVCRVRVLLKEPVPRCDASFPLFPLWLFLSPSSSSSFPVLLSPLLGGHTVTPKCFSGLLLYIFFFLPFFTHSCFLCVCLSVLAAILSSAPLYSCRL